MTHEIRPPSRRTPELPPLDLTPLQPLTVCQSDLASNELYEWGDIHGRGILLPNRDERLYVVTYDSAMCDFWMQMCSERMTPEDFRNVNALKRRQNPMFLWLTLSEVKETLTVGFPNAGQTGGSPLAPLAGTTSPDKSVREEKCEECEEDSVGWVEKTLTKFGLWD